MRASQNARKRIFAQERNQASDLFPSGLRRELMHVEANAFVAEVYRRMSLRANVAAIQPPSESRIADVCREYAPHLPAAKDAAILDIGYGDGWFMAACLKLGYTNITGAEFNPQSKPYLAQWGVKLHRIESDIGELLAQQPQTYDFIHLSHVIEHIPKYSLLWVVDSLYFALRPHGTLFLRTPNMEGPTPTSSYFVTLGHEYGFAGSNLQSLLHICGFDDVQFLSSLPNAKNLKQRVGGWLRWPYVANNRAKHRLFGVNEGGQYGTELVVKAVRNNFSPLMNEKYR